MIVAVKRGNRIGAVDEARPSGRVDRMDAVVRPRVKMPGRQHKLSQQHNHREGREGGLSPALLHSTGLQTQLHSTRTLRHEKDHLPAEMSLKPGGLAKESRFNSSAAAIECRYRPTVPGGDS